MQLEIPQFQPLGPIPLVKIHQHRLFKLGLPVIHSDRIVMPIKSVNQSLDARFINVSDVRRRLTRFLAAHDGMRVYQAEGVDNDLSFH